MSDFLQPGDDSIQEVFLGHFPARLPDGRIITTPVYSASRIPSAVMEGQPRFAIPLPLDGIAGLSREMIEHGDIYLVWCWPP